MSRKHLPSSLRIEGEAIDLPHDAVVVFVDHQHARLVFLDGIDLEEATFAQVRLVEPHRRFRMSDRSEGARFGKAHPDETALYDAVIAAIGRCTRAIVVGPGTARRELMARAGTSTLAEQLELEAAAQARLGDSPDFLEGVAAFREKRPAKFGKR